MREFAKAFYESPAWRRTRAYILKRDAGLCVHCGEPGVIVHHKIELTPRNIDDPAIALGEDNLETVCRTCHALIHEGTPPLADGLAFDADGNTVAKTASLTEANVIALYGLLGDGYERNAVWCMNKATFFSDFFPLMNKSKNNVIEFANGKYYIMGAEVYFTGSLAAHEAYLGDFSYIIGNYSQDITVVRSEHSGLATNSIDYLGACVFDSKPVAGFGAFVHLAKATA